MSFIRDSGATFFSHPVKKNAQPHTIIPRTERFIIIPFKKNKTLSTNITGLRHICIVMPVFFCNCFFNVLFQLFRAHFSGTKNASVNYGKRNGGCMKPCNKNILESLEMSRQLLFLADKGDIESDDSGCGVLYGIIRDTAYRIKAEAERELEEHKKSGKWDY
jgi:hypothetical protein